MGSARNAHGCFLCGSILRTSLSLSHAVDELSLRHLHCSRYTTGITPTHAVDELSLRHLSCSRYDNCAVGACLCCKAGMSITRNSGLSETGTSTTENNCTCGTVTVLSARTAVPPSGTALAAPLLFSEREPSTLSMNCIYGTFTVSWRVPTECQMYLPSTSGPPSALRPRITRSHQHF